MKKIKFIIILSAAIPLLSVSCRKEHIAPVNQLVKDLFCFKVGSEWTYYDSVSCASMIMNISEYKQFKSSYLKPYGKVHDFAELIEIDILIKNMTQYYGNTRLEADIDKDNTLRKDVSTIYTPIGDYLHISCDQDNNFIPSATYLATCIINGTTYSNVYVFKKDDVAYYVSKCTGFIRCINHGEFDWVLIDKNVQQ